MSYTKIETLSELKSYLDGEHNPVIKNKKGKEITFPCLHTVLVNSDLVKLNNYNPNSMSVDKMHSLKQSILDNGFSFPIVTSFDDEDEVLVVIDGEHRYLMNTGEWLNIGYVPVVILSHDQTKRMYATVQFNKAKGTHDIDKDASLVKKLTEQGQDDDQIAKHLGIDIDTVKRYQSVSGIIGIYDDVEWSPAWEMEDDD